ncbi:MAG: hypothetical protein LBP59_13325 [Planctomycetaceae bacterium]|nr:hypothetical protein [Planctomycetaceae bacterium]
MQARRPRSVGLACFSESQALQNRKISSCVSSDSQAERLHHRIAGVSPACGCTQPLMSELDIWASLTIHFCPVRGKYLLLQ